MHLNHILIEAGSAQRISEGHARRAKNNFHAIIVFCKKKNSQITLMTRTCQHASRRNYK